MIIYGTKNRTVNGSELEADACSNCGGTKFLSYGFQKFFHLYHVPTLPIGRTAGTQCVGCNKQMTGSQLPDGLRARIKSSVFSLKDTLLSMIGILVLVVLIAFGTVFAQQSDTEELAFIAAPAAGDLYTIRYSKVLGVKPDGYDYGIMKVSGVQDDMVNFVLSAVSYNKAKGPRKDISSGKVKAADYFTPQSVAFSIPELQKMHGDSAIRSVDR